MDSSPPRPLRKCDPSPPRNTLVADCLQEDSEGSFDGDSSDAQEWEYDVFPPLVDSESSDSEKETESEAEDGKAEEVEPLGGTSPVKKEEPSPKSTPSGKALKARYPDYSAGVYDKKEWSVRKMKKRGQFELQAASTKDKYVVRSDTGPTASPILLNRYRRHSSTSASACCTSRALGPCSTPVRAGAIGAAGTRPASRG